MPDNQVLREMTESTADPARSVYNVHSRHLRFVQNILSDVRNSLKCCMV